MRIALLHNEPLPSSYHSHGEGVAVSSVMESVTAVEEALRWAGHQITVQGLRPPLADARAQVSNLKAELVFNLFEGFEGSPETECQLVRELELAGIAFTGGSSAALALCLDKGKTKEVLAQHGIPTAAYQLLDSTNMDQLRVSLPAIVKPLREDASHGLGSQSVVSDLPSLERQVWSVEQRFGGPALVEEFLSGREFNVSILGGATPQILPISEIVYSPGLSGPAILTYDAKWSPQHPAYRASLPRCPTCLSGLRQQEIERVALAAYQAVGSPPYARVDLRCDDAGRPNVLEVNPNPDLSPEAGMALQAAAAGWSYGRLIELIVALAMRQIDSTKVTYRQMKPADLADLVRITDNTGYFRPDEVAVAEEVLTAAALGKNGDYQVYVAVSAEHLLGYVCFGPTPLTKGTWDMYWLAVDPAHQRRGIGRQLMLLGEEKIRRERGRLIVLETSSQDIYESTRRFHRSLGYQERGRIPDFYDVGDDQIILTKVVNTLDRAGGPP
ncbi:MAG TPA: GNAT family N-acetyltransferase [Dehalococcoidia bacterium]|nr:GNAT family N-acetyltransferase [Dehalococcoidia bacterium]